jgi:hypothetical protein
MDAGWANFDPSEESADESQSRDPSDHAADGNQEVEVLVRVAPSVPGHVDDSINSARLVTSNRGRTHWAA